MMSSANSAVLSRFERASCGRSDRRGEGLAENPQQASTAQADPGGCPHIPRDADRDLRTRLLQGGFALTDFHLLGHLRYSDAAVRKRNLKAFTL